MNGGSDEGREVTVLRSAEVAGDAGVPREVLVAPWGVVESASGTFVVDEEGGRLVIAAFEAQGTDLPIDYEHQTLGGGYASPTGQAPAAGWIKRLWVRGPSEVGAPRDSDPPCPPLSRGGEEGAASGEAALQNEDAASGEAALHDEDAASGEAALHRSSSSVPGLYAEVEWTGPAREQLAARQYRYLSPVAIVRKSDRRLVALHSAALTNKPAIVGMCPIVNRSDMATERRSEEGMDSRRGGTGERRGGEAGERCRDAQTRGRGDREVQTPEGVVKDASRRGAETQRCGQKEVHEMTELLERLRGQLGLEETAEDTAVVAAACERLSSLTDAARRSEAETRVVAAMEAGKLTEAQREWAVALAMKDPTAFEAWEASAPVVVQVGRIDGTARDEGAAWRGGGAGVERDRIVIASKARAEFRANPELELLTSEEAYVGLALRERGLSNED